MSERKRPRREGGFVLVWFAIMMVVLIGVGGLAVDFSGTYFTGTRAQKAADAAALAGAIFMPENTGNQAFTTAALVAQSNGFTDGVDGTTVTVVQGDRANQLKVTITKSVKTVLAGVLGFNTLTTTKTATAEYQKPVAMGSPSNQFGNDPESAGVPGSFGYPNFWANVAGGGSVKVNGDAFQGGTCAGGVDNCQGPPASNPCGYSGSNHDYDCNGYYYAVRVTAAGSPLVLQAFDPGFVHVGDVCGADDDGSKLAGAALLPRALIPGYPAGGADPIVRYLPVLNPNSATDPGLRYCTGDAKFSGGSGLPKTTFKVYGPAGLPGDPASAPLVSGCTKTFPGVKGDLSSLLQSPTVAPGAPDLLGAYFRQWYTLCTINGATVGDYFIQVKTEPNDGYGHNRFALRAKGSPAGVSIFGNEKMGIYANAGTGLLTQFYMARVTPGAPGRSLVLNLYDIGDAANGSTGMLRIVPPPDANIGSTFSGCSYTPPPGTSTGPPWGVAQPTSNDCSISGVGSAYNGQWVQFHIPIPDNYNCDSSDPFNCWVRINYQFSGGVLDTTSWTAFIDGDPVRIIK